VGKERVLFEAEGGKWDGIQRCVVFFSNQGGAPTIVHKVGVRLKKTSTKGSREDLTMTMGNQKNFDQLETSKKGAKRKGVQAQGSQRRS
jgi:hypothetical protein